MGEQLKRGHSHYLLLQRALFWGQPTAYDSRTSI